jgi:pSer/pThr/pTyr-binding forkhead associated (FHA) protein
VRAVTQTLYVDWSDPRSDIVPADPLISASQAEVCIEPAGAAVADLGSKNGT